MWAEIFVGHPVRSRRGSLFYLFKVFPVITIISNVTHNQNTKSTHLTKSWFYQPNSIRKSCILLVSISRRPDAMVIYFLDQSMTFNHVQKPTKANVDVVTVRVLR